MSSIIIVLPILTVLMFDLGLTLTASDFLAIARHPRPVLVGLFGQLVLLPALALGVAHLFALPEMLRIGLVLVACCPGGSSSNVFARLARGDVSLSVTLTALSSVITLFTIPIVLSFAVAESHIELPALRLFMQNIVLVMVPLLLGMLLRRWRVEWAQSLDAVLSRCALPALVLLTSIYFVQNRDAIVSNIGVLGLCVTTLLLACVFGACLLAIAFGLRREQRRTIVIEVGMQNAAQAIAIAASPFVLADEGYAVPAIIYALLMNVVLLCYIAVTRYRDIQTKMQ